MYVNDDGRIHYHGDFNKYSGTYLPHWDVEDGLYFLTFRLADSIPQETLEQLATRYRIELDAIRRREDTDARDLAEFALEFYLDRIDGALDSGRGACFLKHPEVAELVANSLRHFDGERYELFAWVVMPNHVHTVFRRVPDWPLSRVVGGWKSYTAHRASEFVDFGDHFWQGEYFDRLIRTRDEFRDTVAYVWENPDRAGLDRWDWRGTEVDDRVSLR